MCRRAFLKGDKSGKKGKEITYKEPKTKSSIRQIDIGKNLSSLLRDHRKEQTKLMELFDNKSNLVFSMEDLMPTDPDIISKRFYRAIKDTDF